MFSGGPTAAVIALQNPHIDVTVVDKDAARIAKWNSRHLPVHEPGLYDVVRSARDGLRATTIQPGATLGSPSNISARGPNLFFSTEIAKAITEADLILLSVNTPTKTTGVGAGQATNMSALEGATRDIALAAKPGAIIVEKSTVPCRTAQIIRDTVCNPSPHHTLCCPLANDVPARSLSTRRSFRNPFQSRIPRRRNGD
jgi:UDPglucose 6-dehydrogenase